MSRTYSHLTLEQRNQIKKMLDNGCRKSEIAQALSVHISTVYREIERGSINGQYEPNYSEEIYRLQRLECGPKPILSIEQDLAEYIAKLILEYNFTPARIVNELKKGGEFESIPKSAKTIYNAIENGLIPGVTKECLNSNITTVFSDGQIHIAKWVRELLDIKDGDRLHFEVVDGKLIFSKGIEQFT